MTKKEKLAAALQGILVLAQLKEEGSYVLGLISKKGNLFAPFIRKDKGTAYISPDYNDLQYAQLEEAIDLINSEKAFPIAKFSPKGKEAPTFDKTIVRYVKPVGFEHILPKNCKEIFEKAGYTVLETAATEGPFVPRDYGTQVEDDENFKTQYEEEKAFLEKNKIRYDKFDDDLEVQYEAIKNGSRAGVLLVGPAGVGKSVLTMAFGVRAKAHRIDLQISPTTQPEDLEGKYVPDDTPGSQKNWKFVEGPVLEAWSKGYVLSIQELNFALAGANSCLNKYLDGTLYVTIDDKTYHRHPNFVFLATMNAGYEDTEKLNQALKNRYSIVQIEPLTEAQFCQRITNHSELLGHPISIDFAKEIYNFGSFMQKQASSGTWHENVDFGYRNAERFLDDILLKPRSLALFTSALHAAYTNALSCDNNNTEKLLTFKKSEELQNYIKKLYSFYDFSESKTVEVVEDFDSIFGVVDEEVEEETKTEETKIMDDLYKRFDL